MTTKHEDNAALLRTCSGRQVEIVVKMFLDAKEHRMSRSGSGTVAMLAAEFANKKTDNRQQQTAAG